MPSVTFITDGLALFLLSPSSRQHSGIVCVVSLCRIQEQQWCVGVLMFLLTVLRRRLTFLELKDLCLLFTVSEFLGPGWELSDFL